MDAAAVDEMNLQVGMHWNMRGGRVAYAVLSFGGFLGMGKKLFAVPRIALPLDTAAIHDYYGAKPDSYEPRH